MPEITATPEEQAEIERLLTKYEPETHPRTKPVLSMLSDEARAAALAYTRESMEKNVAIALAMKAVVEAVGEFSLFGESLDFFGSLKDAFYSTMGGRKQSETEIRFRDLCGCLGDVDEYPETVEGTFEYFALRPALELLDQRREEQERAIAEAIADQREKVTA